MSFDTWLAFAIPTFLICITPGPNMMLMLSIGLQQGLKGAIPAMLGAVMVVLLMMVASALGLGLILEQSPKLFTAIKWIGAAYLAYLGLQLVWQGIMPTKATPPLVESGELVDTLKADSTTEVASSASQSAATSAKLPTTSATDENRRSFWDNMGKAMAVAGSNPKAIVFAAAYFPQFINTKAAAWPQLAVLLPTFIVLEGACYVLYALSGQSLAAWFAKPLVLRRFNMGIGLIFVAFGVLLALN